MTEITKYATAAEAHDAMHEDQVWPSFRYWVDFHGREERYTRAVLRGTDKPTLEQLEKLYALGCAVLVMPVPNKFENDHG